MSLQEIKDQVAKEHSYPEWKFVPAEKEYYMWPIICERACEETGRLTLEKALENVEYHDGSILDSVAILDPSNIVIVK